MTVVTTFSEGWYGREKVEAVMGSLLSPLADVSVQGCVLLSVIHDVFLVLWLG